MRQSSRPCGGDLHVEPGAREQADGNPHLGAEVRIVGTSQDDAQDEVDRLVAEDGLMMLPPFDHPDIIAGQGTLGLEIIEEVPDARRFWCRFRAAD